MNIYLGENIGFCLFVCMFLALKGQIKYSTKTMKKIFQTEVYPQEKLTTSDSRMISQTLKGK